MKSPAFQFYAGDYLADAQVMMMTLEQEGAYIRLLAICWREGNIPADLKSLSMLCKGASPAVLRVVTKCFQPNANQPGTLIHKRLNEEIEKQAEWRAKSAAGGKKSAEKRWGDKGGGKGGTNQSVTLQSSTSSSSTTDVVPRATGDDTQALPAEEKKAPRGEVAAGDNDLFTADTIPFLNDARLFGIACENVGYDPANLNAEVYRKQVRATAKAAGMKAGVLQFQNYLKKYLNNEAKSKDGIMAAPVVAPVPTAFPSDPRDLWGFNEVREPAPAYTPQPAGQYTGSIN